MIDIIQLVGRISIIALGGVLWRLGGVQNGRLYRRIGVPAILAIICFLQTGNWIIAGLTMLIAWGVVSIGYGIPDPGGDTGSTIGAFWYKTTKNIKKARILTRLSIGLLYSCTFIPILYMNFEISKLVQALLLPFIIILIVEKEVGPLKEETSIGASFITMYVL